MRTRTVLIGLALLLGAAALAVYLFTARFETTLEFRLEDGTSGQWVWNAAARIQDRLLRSFYQSDAGTVPLTFTHLKPGPSTLKISALGYVPVSVPVTLHRGSNRLAQPIALVGFEIPGLERFYVFESLDRGDIVCQIRPVGADGRAVLNHPCIPLWVACRVTVQMRGGRPAVESSETGNTRGQELFRGTVPWQWSARPEAVFRYSARIPQADMKPDPSLFRVIDYAIVLPDPRLITAKEFQAVMEGAPDLRDAGNLAAYLDRQGNRLRCFFDTSWNVPGREE